MNPDSNNIIPESLERDLFPTEAKYGMPAICFVIVWYGPLPAYFPNFMHSVAGHPFQVLFITDQTAPPGMPENFRWKQKTWEQLLAHFESVLGVKVQIPAPYKLCDYKPAFGYLFCDWLKPYSFWGCLDTDVVMGNFQSFITPTLLEKADFISGLRAYVSGCFFLVRNQPQLNTLFQQSRSWQAVCQTGEYLCFDECNKYWEPLKAGADILTLNTPVQSFTELLILESRQGLRVHFTDLALEPRGFHPVEVRAGSIRQQDTEYLLLHLLYYKTRPWFMYNIHHTRPPYFANAYGTFSSRPTPINFLFSKNAWISLYRKWVNQWDKLAYKKKSPVLLHG